LNYDATRLSLRLCLRRHGGGCGLPARHLLVRQPPVLQLRVRRRLPVHDDQLQHRLVLQRLTGVKLPRQAPSQPKQTVGPVSPVISREHGPTCHNTHALPTQKPTEHGSSAVGHTRPVTISNEGVMNRKEDQPSSVLTNTTNNSPGRVVIVGAGPGGMALAYLLARRGVAVTVLESHQDFARSFRGEGLQRSGIDAFRQMGLGERLDQLPHVELKTIEIYSS